MPNVNAVPSFDFLGYFAREVKLCGSSNTNPARFYLALLVHFAIGLAAEKSNARMEVPYNEATQKVEGFMKRFEEQLKPLPQQDQKVKRLLCLSYLVELVVNHEFAEMSREAACV
jgi:hypothetical protein